MNKFTLGPWKTVEHTEFRDGNLVGYPVVYPAGDWYRDKPLCRVFGGFEGINAEANARLIAAAPEMLEALKQVERYLSRSGEASLLDSFGVTQAIAKAEGRE